jgi:hypothetical protein
MSESSGESNTVVVKKLSSVLDNVKINKLAPAKLALTKLSLLKLALAKATPA